MKILNYIVVFALLLSFSCNKQNETPLNPVSTTETQNDFAENTGLFYFDIPLDYKANNNNTGNTELISEIISINDQEINVDIELIRSEDGEVISLGVSNEFAEIMEINQLSFLMDNESVFATYYESEERGWLGRFFIGRKKQTPCAFHQNRSYNDHWLFGDYGYSQPKPC